MNPAVKKALWPVLALVFGALATYFSTGCSGDLVTVEMPDVVVVSECVQAALEAKPATQEELLASVLACVHGADAGDAGA